MRADKLKLNPDKREVLPAVSNPAPRDVVSPVQGGDGFSLAQATLGVGREGG